MKPIIIKIIAVVFLVILVLNLVLIASGMMSWQFFWIIILLAAFVAYIAIPWLKKRT